MIVILHESDLTDTGRRALKNGAALCVGDFRYSPQLIAYAPEVIFERPDGTRHYLKSGARISRTPRGAWLDERDCGDVTAALQAHIENIDTMLMDPWASADIGMDVNQERNRAAALLSRVEPQAERPQCKSE